MSKSAVIYKRTSSNKNCGEGKDSGTRQEKTCTDYAKSNGYKINNVFYDEGVSGSTNVYERPAFVDLLLHCNKNNIQHIIVEKIDRFW